MSGEFSSFSKIKLIILIKNHQRYTNVQSLLPRAVTLIKFFSEVFFVSNFADF